MYVSFYFGTVGVCMRQERVKWQSGEKFWVQLVSILNWLLFQYSWSVRCDPVTWLLIEGRCCWLVNASMICSLLKSCCRWIIFVLLTSCSRVRAVLWMFVVWDLGPPEARYMVRWRDRVYVIPIYEHFWSSQSSIQYLYSYMILVCFRVGSFGLLLFLLTRLLTVFRG